MEATDDSTQGFAIYPIGHISNRLNDKAFDLLPDEDPAEREARLNAHRKELAESTSVVEVMPEYITLLDGIEAFSHIVILFWPHRLPEEKRRLEKVHPRGWKDIPRQGIFATRSPARPNPVLFSTVRLVERQQRQLYVKGLDAMDQSPVIDIKPVIKPSDVTGAFRVPNWVHRILADE